MTLAHAILAAHTVGTRQRCWGCLGTGGICAALYRQQRLVRGCT